MKTGLRGGRVLLRLRRRGDLVTHAPNGDDGRGVLELAAQLAHVHIDRARIAGEGVTPDPLEQLVARQDEPAMIEKLPQQVELLGRKLDLLVADVHLTPSRVDVQIAVLDRLVLALAPLGRGATEDRADTRNELARVERLRQVI